jgi:valyl-tRNA synthetase
MHPWMPFITEEIWHLMKERNERDCIIVAEWPKASATNQKLITDFEQCKEIVTQTRNIRQQKQLSPKEKLALFYRLQDESSLFAETVKRLANLSELTHTKDKLEKAYSFVIGTIEFYVPLAGNIDAEAEKERLTKELEYNQGFLKSVQAKLANEKFVANAKPELVELEKKKKADAESKIQTLKEQLAAL